MSLNDSHHSQNDEFPIKRPVYSDDEDDDEFAKALMMSMETEPLETIDKDSDFVIKDIVTSEPATTCEPKIKNKTKKKNKSKKKHRCFQCNKKVPISFRMKCRCGEMFCMTHRHSFDHNCQADHSTEYREKLRKENPLVQFSKLNAL